MRTISRRRRPVWLLPLLFVVIAFGGGVVQPMAHPGGAEAKSTFLGLPNPAIVACNALPDSTARRICKAAVDPVGTAIGLVPGIPGIPNIPGAIAGSAVDATIGRLAQIAGGWLVNKAMVNIEQYVSSGTTADLNAPWFVHLFDWFYWYADGIAIVCLFAALIIDLKRVDLGGVAFTMARFAIFVAFIATLPEMVNGYQMVMHHQVTPQILNLTNQQGNNLFKTVIAKSNHDLGATGDIYALFGLMLVCGVGAVFAFIIKIILDLVALGIVVYTLLSAWTFAMFVFGKGGQLAFIKNLTILAVLGAFSTIMALMFYVALSLANQPNAGSDTITQVVAMLIGIVAVPMAAYRWASNHQVDAVGHVNRGASRVGKTAKAAYVARKAAIVAAAA